MAFQITTNRPPQHNLQHTAERTSEKSTAGKECASSRVGRRLSHGCCPRCSLQQQQQQSWSCSYPQEDRFLVTPDRMPILAQLSTTGIPNHRPRCAAAQPYLQPSQAMNGGQPDALMACCFERLPGTAVCGCKEHAL